MNETGEQPKKSISKKWWFLVLIIFGGIAVFCILYLFQPWVYLPHQKMQMSLPFSSDSDATVGFIPMGEKIEHNESNGNPNGHPGIDFGFSKETDILAVSDGLITAISYPEGKLRIEERTWFYRIEYTELNTLEPGIHFLSYVKKGQVIGQVGSNESLNDKFKKGAKSRQMHWDFASSSMSIDRLCPVNYFDAESKARLLKIWAEKPADDIFKKEYPEICNGFYQNKED